MSFDNIDIHSEQGNLLTFGNPELDRRIGGLPIPSLNLIEGPNDSGKTIISQQITYGALVNGFKVLFITTEGTSKGLINQMKALHWNVEDYFLNGDLKITPLHTAGMAWNSEISKYYLTALTNFVKKKLERIDVVIIDSLTHLVTHADANDVLDFFSSCRYIVDTLSKTFIITMHPYALDQDLLIRIRAFCDGHFILEIRTFRNKSALTMTISKLRGATQPVNEIISFEVSPAFGIKILPFMTARG